MSTHAIRFCREVRKTAGRYGLPFFVVTDGAWSYNNDGCNEVRNARIDHLAYKRSEVSVPDEDCWDEEDCDSTIDGDVRCECDFDGCIVGCFNTEAYGGELFVETNDAVEVPHFHIRNNQSGIRNDYGFMTGIEFLKPAYLHQQSPKDVLNDKQKVALNDFLGSVVTQNKKLKEAGVTVWEMCCLLWNWNNSEHDELPDGLEMPDYTKLPN